MKVMFVCKANVGRSQVAQVYFELSSVHESSSSGTHVDELMAKQNPPSALLKDNSQYSLPYMREQGIDIGERSRTQLTPEMIEDADRIIAILSQEEIPSYLAANEKLTLWDLPDPEEIGKEAAWPVFDEIKLRVSALVQEIG